MIDLKKPGKYLGVKWKKEFSNFFSLTKYIAGKIGA